MKEYRVIELEGKEVFENAINSKLREGWELIGGVSIRPRVSGNTWYGQSMYREQTEEQLEARFANVAFVSTAPYAKVEEFTESKEMELRLKQLLTSGDTYLRVASGKLTLWKELLLDAWERMDRVRNILIKGNPTWDNNWGALDTKLDREKL